MPTMKGKERCKILKDIRQRIADENDIPYVTSECPHKGDCLGTCPKCEAELAYLEREVNRRRSLGKVVTVAGLAVVTAVSGGCVLTPNGAGHGGALDGDMVMPNTQAIDSDIAGGLLPPDGTEIPILGEVEEKNTTELPLTGDACATHIAGVPPLPETDVEMGELVPDTLMGDIAYFPAPDMAELAGLDADSISSRLLSCYRDDLRVAWADYFVKAASQADTFRLGKSEKYLVVTYDDGGFVTRVAIQ